MNNNAGAPFKDKQRMVVPFHVPYTDGVCSCPVANSGPGGSSRPLLDGDERSALGHHQDVQRLSGHRWRQLGPLGLCEHG